MDKKQYNIGILGAANIARRVVIEPAKQLETVCVFGIAARDCARAEKFAHDHGIAQVFPDYNALIESDAIDAVYIPLANHVHAPWVIKVAQAKKAIFVEKPICLTVKEFDAIEAAVTENKVPLVETVMVQHHPWQEKVRDIITTQQYGALRSTKTEVSFRLRDVDQNSYRLFPEMGGGVFFDVGSYWIQFVQACIGLPPDTIEAHSDFDGPNGIDMTFEARMDFAQGVSAAFCCSFERAFEVTHWLQLENARMRIRNFFRPAFGNQAMAIDVHHLETGEREKIKFPPQNYYCNQLDFFLRVIEGKAKNIPLMQIRERVKLMEQIYTVAQSHRNSQ